MTVLGNFAVRTANMTAKPIASPSLAAEVQRVFAGHIFTHLNQEIHGISLAGQSTSIVLPRAGVAFDVGRCPQKTCFQETVCISHGHMDHIGGLGFQVATRGLLRLTPPRVLFPPPLTEPVEQLMQVHRILDGSTMNYIPHPISPGTVHELTQQSILVPFPTVHPVPSQGYMIYWRKQKLKPEYQGLPGNQIRDMRLAGVEVTETVLTPEVAFTGDTSIEFLDVIGRDHDVLKAKLLILEMTFLDATPDPADALSMGHMHLDQLIERADWFDGVGDILLIHFSPRYRQAEILELLNAKLPEGLRRKTHAFLEGFAE